MPDPMIRETEADDLPAILALYPLAFPGEELRPLVTDLLDGGHGVLSLAAVEGRAVIGHVLFTLFDGRGALLGPLAVVPERQGRGVGSALVRSGLERLDGVGTVLVLGDPAYYGRFGFRREARVLPPYALPSVWEGAWQSLGLPGCPPLEPGRCALPAPWMARGLWEP